VSAVSLAQRDYWRRKNMPSKAVLQHLVNNNTDEEICKKYNLRMAVLKYWMQVLRVK